MSEHPTPAELLDLHFGEARGERQPRTAAHLATCPRCQADLRSVEWLERSLAALPEEAPPADGLARVMERVAPGRPRRPSRAEWLWPLAATVGGVATGAGAIYAAGSRLVAATPAATAPLLEWARVATGFGLATAVFFGIGSLVTLALAPALLIEAQARARTAQ